MRDITAAAVQFEPIAGNKSANLETIERFTVKAHAQGVQLIAFPECCVTGYWFLRRLSASEVGALAEPAFNGPSAIRISDLSRRFEMTIGAGLIERGDDECLYNCYVVAMPDGTLQRHRKLHAFEHESIRCGTEYTVFDTPHGCRVGVLICYDLNLVENARISALMGAEVLLAPHQTGGCRTTNPHLMGAIDRAAWDNRHADPQSIDREIRGDKGRGWLMRWLPSRAHDNGMFVVFSNGVGIDDDEIRTGNSMILDPYGRILAETCRAGEDMVVARLDASLLERSTGRMWMQARRPELYAPIARRTGRERETRELKFEE